MQELLQRLLRAEAKLEERECCSKGIRQGHITQIGYQTLALEEVACNYANAAEKSGNNTGCLNTNSHDQQQGETSLKTVKCYNCL